ncbi:MAG: sucrase ferredoxin [Spirulinaceae cyanobacterium]
MNNPEKCRFCCETSQQNGEDTLGTLFPFDSWCIIEAKQPWKYKIWMEANPIPQTVLDLFREIHQAQKIKLRQLAIAPDPEYSRPNYTRILHYSRPSQFFAQYDKKDYLIPSEWVAELILALYKQPKQLAKFDQYRQDTDKTREILVCTHGNVDAACARFGYPIYKQLRQDHTTPHLRVWRCSHFGGHQFAPTLVDMPSGRSWGHLKPEILPQIINRQGNISELRPFYRGHFGLPPFAQMVEGEIWLQKGWEWYDYAKAGQVLEVNEDQTKVIVQIDFTSPDLQQQGRYHAVLQQTQTVMTQYQTEDATLTPVPQYQVSELKRVEA